MRIVTVDNLQTGDILARTLVDEHGQVLLQKGVRLTERYIGTLRAKGYTRLFVAEEHDDPDLLPDDELSDATRSKAVKAINECYTAIESEVGTVRSASARDLREVFDSKGVRDLLGPNGPVSQVYKLLDEILNDILDHATLAGLTSLKSSDNALYQHCLDVCVVGVFVAKALRQPDKRIKQYAAGALLHDIGRVFVPKGLGREAYIKQHTLLGFELLRRGEQPDILAPHVAYEHHEQQDGAGLPRGLKGSNKIERDRGAAGPVPTLIGEIAAVANAYDNMLSGADGGQALTPEQALRTLHAGAGSRYNAAVVRGLVRVVPIYPLGFSVVVIEGPPKHCTGQVVRVNPNDPDKPIIALYRDAKGKSMSPMRIDLRENDKVKVRLVLDS